MFITLILKGFLIGIAFIVPGLSGGTLAVYLGVYDKLLHSIGNIFKEFKKSVTFLIPIFLGIAISVVLTAKVFSILLDWNSFIVLFFFIGLMLGGLKSLSENVENKKQASNIISFIVAFLIVILLVVFEKLTTTSAISVIGTDIGSLIVVFLVGMAASMTMIVPGISGSALLLVLGFYTAIVSNIIGNITDMDALGYNVTILIPFLLGAAVGVILFSRLISFTLEKYKSQTYSAILGFIVASCIAIFFEIRDPSTAAALEDQLPIYKDIFGYLGSNILTLLGGIVTLVLGFLTSKLWLNRRETAKE